MSAVDADVPCQSVAALVADRFALDETTADLTIDALGVENRNALIADCYQRCLTRLTESLVARGGGH
jgi:hypothetical protein